MRRHSAMDMTHGPLLGKILWFSLPLMASNVLQLLFNAADVIVVGRYAGYNSLAAVGSTTSVVYLVTNLLIGLSVGVNVMVARYIGEGQRREKIAGILRTSMFVALAGGVLLGGVGLLLTDSLLALMNTPAEIFDLTGLYLKIYFLGSPAVMVYNYGAAALRAAGDTKRPLLYLTISGILNLVLNLFFVIALQMDVAGVALATVISETVSAALVFLSISKQRELFGFSWKNLRPDGESLRNLALIGVPAGVQSCLFSLSNVVIQGAVNAYGSVVMAGCSVGSSIENFIYTSMNAYHLTSQTFLSQNIGAGRYDRVGKVVRICMLCTLVLGILEGIGAVAFAPQLISIYNTDPAVIDQGTLRLHVVASVYVIFGIADVLIGTIRGCGRPIAPVVINLLGTCVFRIVWIALLDTDQQGVEWVYLSYPVSWAVILAALAVFWVGLWKREIVNRRQDTGHTEHHY